MRAVVIAIDARPGALEAPIDLLVHVVDEVLVDDAATHGGLVRDDHRRKPGSLQQSQGISRPREQRQVIESIQVATLLDECAVAIEKHGGLAHGSGSGIRDPGLGIRRSRFEVRSSSFVINSVTVASTRSADKRVMQR